MNFRNEIFQLCKKIQKNSDTNEISNLIHDFSIVKEGEDYNTKNCDFKQVASHSRNQFYGYLYTNEHTDEYLTIFPHIRPLTTNEYKIIAKGHSTIIFLIEECISEFKERFPSIYFALHPYSKYKSIKPIDTPPILEPSDYNNAINSFKSSDLYQKLYNSNINVILNEFDNNHIGMMFSVLEKEIDNCPLHILPESINNFMKCIHTDYKDMPDIIMAEILLILGLRKALENASSLLFTALVGEDLIVLDNNNIITIDKNFSNILHKVFQISCNDIFLARADNTVGNILLIDCIPSEKNHIHEFGFITSYTATWSQEVGNTSKITAITVDDTLNPIYTLTNEIIKKEFPPVINHQTNSMYKSNSSTQPPVKSKISRNDKCPCGSGLKYKHCCGKNN